MASKPTAFGPLTLIPGDKGARFPYCNSLYIEQARLIIDPSSNRTILEKLYRDRKIGTVCLTHWHEDHFRFFYLLDGCRFWISRTDSIPMADSREFLKWYGLDTPEAAGLREMIKTKMAAEIRYKPRTPDRFLRDGDLIDLGPVSMEVIASPGHSPGHMSFYFPEPSVLFLGDYNLDPFGPWTGDPFSDIDQCIASIQRLRQVPAQTLIAGHRPEPVTSGIETLWDQYLNAIFAREEKLASFLSEPRTMDDIIDQWMILGKVKEPVDYFRFGEKTHIEKHLTRLIRHKIVELTDGRYRRT